MLAASLLMSTSGCNSFPLVGNAIINSNHTDAYEHAYLCTRRLPDGSLVEVDEILCAEQQSCLITNADGDQAVAPMQACNNHICYSARDHERILKWGRKHCK